MGWLGWLPNATNITNVGLNVGLVGLVSELTREDLRQEELNTYSRKNAGLG